jgi:serine protease
MIRILFFTIFRITLKLNEMKLKVLALFGLLIISGNVIGQSAHLVCKFLPEFEARIQTIIEDLGTGVYPIHLEQKFPSHKLNYKSDYEGVHLGLIYTSEITTDPLKTIQKLKRTEYFEYVELLRSHKLSFTPNDPSLSDQNYLSQINAFQAWDSEKGSSSVTIGIVDTGTDTDHPDLQNKIQANLNDPINGLDDDADGFVDNYLGWDFVENDGNPQIDADPHGAQMSGISAAETDNAVGIASVGFNTMFLPVKVNPDLSLSQAYDAVVYAADQGADIINCSWGAFGYSAYEQDIIDYATLVRGALVVAAAGNENTESLFYPAAYNNVLAVGSVNSTDVRSVFSNYGYWVDIMAPGQNIISTTDNGGYSFSSGTSVSAPIVSAAASLVKNHFPAYNARQIGERLRISAENIDGIPGNSGYSGKLGLGRLDVAKAIDAGYLSPSVRLEDLVIAGSSNPVSGDTISIYSNFTNYLDPSGSLALTLSSSSSDVSIIQGSYNLGTLNTLETKSTKSNPFKIKISDNALTQSSSILTISWTDGSYEGSFSFEIFFNTDYLTLNPNDIQTTITASGLIGYDDNVADRGIGFIWNGGLSSLFEGGLMLGRFENSVFSVMDNIRETPSTSDEDFSSIVPAIRIIPPLAESDFVVSRFEDRFGGADKLDVEIRQHSYGYRDDGHEGYVVLEYSIKNIGTSDLNDFHAGLFLDWDVGNFEKNRSATDHQRYTTYTYEDVQMGQYFGAQVLTPLSFGAYCADNVTGGNGGMDITSFYSTEKKYRTLSESRWDAGGSSGNDVVNIVAARNLSLEPGDSIFVAFALHGGSDLNSLLNSADSAFYRYNGSLPNAFENLELSTPIKIYPNPTDAIVNIVSERHNIGLIKLHDLMGNEIIPVVDQRAGKTSILDISNLNSGVYILELGINGKRITRRIIRTGKQ